MSRQFTQVLMEAPGHWPEFSSTLSKTLRDEREGGRVRTYPAIMVADSRTKE